MNLSPLRKALIALLGCAQLAAADPTTQENALRDSAYQQALQNVVASGAFAAAFGHEYVVASAWRPDKNSRIETVRRETRAEVEALYARMRLATPSLQPLMEQIEMERMPVCVKYKKVKKEEKFKSSAKSSSSYYRREYSKDSAAASFSFRGVGRALKRSVVWSSSDETTTRSSSSSSESVSYYWISEDYKCSEYQDYVRAVLKITPDLTRLDAQLIAQILVQVSEVQKDRIVDELDAITKTIVAVGETGIVTNYTGTEMKRLFGAAVGEFSDGDNVGAAAASSLAYHVAETLPKRLESVRQSVERP